jgi:molybdopterin converting factor small subunit
LIKVNIRMLGLLREASGVSTETIELEGKVNVSSIVRWLSEKHGDDFENALIDPIVRNSLPNALVLLNGVEIGNINGLDTTVQDGDSIVLLSVTHGG